MATSPVVRGLALAGLYYAACVFAAVPMQPGSVALMWPAAGVGLAGVMVLGLRHVWFVPLAVLAYHATLGPVPAAFVPFSVASNLLGTLAGGWLATRGALRPVMGLSQALQGLQGGVVLSLVSAVIGIAGLRYAGMIDAADTGPGLLRWVLGDLLGVVAVAPAVLLRRTRSHAAGEAPYRDQGSEPERLAWLVLLVGSYLLMAWAASTGGMYALGVTALPLAMLAWCAMRFPPWWTARAVLFTCLLVGSFASLGMTGFQVPVGPLDTARLLLFLCLLAALPMALALATHERRVAAQRLLRNATIDPITGLPNRTAFERTVREALHAAAPPRALAYIDLDHLKLVNDTASHEAGDAVIRGVAGVLQASLRPGDAVGHLGGDEFGLLLHNCLPTAAEERAQQALRAIEACRCEWEGRSLGVTASIGLVPFQGEQDFARLLSQADAACFTAKEHGGNQVCRAALDGDERLDRTSAMRWAVRVREAIDTRGFQLLAQTIAPLAPDAAPAGRHFELLLRMRDQATGQLLMPGQFLPAADRYRLGVRIDRGVIALALDWLERNADPAEVEVCCINLSAQALVDEGFIGFLGERLRHSAFPPGKLCLEITETSALRDIPRAQRFISQMRARGCRFALDDFGTGFCSFGYLRSLDVDYFKIDGSFVRELHESPLSLQIVRAITDIAHVLDKRSIAEHAETPAQLATLAELGVDMAQGFAVHRPEPIEAYFAREAPVAARAV